MRLHREDILRETDDVQVGEQKKANRLIQEKSPYLLQHAYNPVDWYPWGDEAFTKARIEDKPVFLSVGYSSCYWCHVMEREVFENKEIADLMNLVAVNIKVDREERPDIDRIYMTALQAFTGSGGWPMSLFLTPEGKPFFAGTYFPAETQYGRMGFADLVKRIAEVWDQDRQAIHEQGDKLIQILNDTVHVEPGDSKLSLELLHHGFNACAEQFDSVYGGFGGAPKFPRPVMLQFLFRYYFRTGNLTARDMVLSTLQKMSEGGIYDHLGGGFHRYATDERWHVPHFEKMLYDQAQLAQVYLEAFQITKEQVYAQVVREVLGYVQRALAHPEGGFYSAEDAESKSWRSKNDKSEEGAFYLWTQEEIDALLPPRESQIFKLYYGISPQGNISDPLHTEFKGENTLRVIGSVEEIALQLKLNIEEAQAYLDIARARLSTARDRRPHPRLDDKILLSWNGLMISAFARAYGVLHDESYLTSAIKAADFILKKVYYPASGSLLRRYRESEVRYFAQLSDYSYFIQALLDLYEVSFDVQYLATARQLTDDMIQHFYDHDSGGFFDVSDQDEIVIMKTKESADFAEPNANAVAISNLLRLSHLLEKEQYHLLARESLNIFSMHMEEHPFSVPSFLTVLDTALHSPIQCILTGERNHPLISDMLHEVHRRYIPTKILLLVDGIHSREELSAIIPIVNEPVFHQTKVQAFICENNVCRLPVSDSESFSMELDQSISAQCIQPESVD